MFARRVPSILSSFSPHGIRCTHTRTFSRSLPLLSSPKVRPFSSFSHHSSQHHQYNSNNNNNKLWYLCMGSLSLALYATSRDCKSEADTRPRGGGQVSGGNTFKFKYAATMFPHPDKEFKGGEDAYFVSDSGLVIGVADGVGGWTSKGVDPAIYARALMEGARKYANLHPEVDDPVAIMEAGYSNASQHLGSSTCCIVVLSGAVLKSANLGDSGFMVIRGNQIVYRTKEQQHRFNFPFQLGNSSKDKPQHSNIDKIQVQSGDIVILGTDGLFDNVYDSQILSCVLEIKGASPQKLSDSVAKLARENASRKTGSSPFSDGSTNYGRPRQGGKMDDITVVVGVVA